MQYSARKGKAHGQPVRTGVLLCNLGTPDAPTPAALKKYLAEFLSDPRVVELPRWQWLPVLHGIILNTRPARSAKLYQKVWTDEGSPLLVTSLAQRDKLQVALDASADQIVVEIGMRYGNPSMQVALEALREKNCRKIIVLPLYPQYSGSTSGSTFDALTDILKSWRRVPELHVIDGYHDHEGYISALASSIRKHWAEHEKAEKLIFSFHGIPERYFKAGDPYPCFCRKTARLTAEALELAEGEWQVTFQSRFGKEPWVMPYTDETLQELARQGVKTVDVICPGFSVDCLETLEEIAGENRDLFKHAGGSELRYIPALNDDDAHIRLMASLVRSVIPK